MKKVLISLISLFLISGTSALADGDLWDNFGDQNFYGNQQAVSDKQFQEALDSKLKKKKRNKKFKGQEQHQSNETSEIKATAEEPNILCVPLNLATKQSQIIPIGHYEVIGEKKDGKPVLKLYQAHYLIAELPATETRDDFEQESINFVDIKELNEKQLMIIFGSLDFNAYSVINIAE